jgi:hypothetical protein
MVVLEFINDCPLKTSKHSNQLKQKIGAVNLTQVKKQKIGDASNG